MKWYRKIPIELKARALRPVFRRRLGFMDGASRAWFGFPLRALPAALRAENIGPVPLDHDGWETDKSDASLTDAQVEVLVRYPLCIDLEVTLSELSQLSPEVVAPAREATSGLPYIATEQELADCASQMQR